MRDAILRREGVFSPSHFYSMVVDHLWREWDIPGLLPQAQEARDAQKRLVEWHAKLGRIAARYAARLEHGSSQGRVNRQDKGPLLEAAGVQDSPRRSLRARPTPGPGGSASPSRRPCPAR